MPLTIEEAMAIAVLRGDRAAAHALADKLIEELQDRREIPSHVDRRSFTRQPTPSMVLSEVVYGWPEFRDLCRRLGIAYELGTYSLEIRMHAGEMIRINHIYRGSDTAANPQPGYTEDLYDTGTS